MQGGVGTEIFANVAIERRKGVRRRKLTFEQQPHRIAFVTKGWLHADEDIAEMCAEDMNGLTVALLATGSRAPLRLDLIQISFAADVVVGTDPCGDIGIGAELLGIALEDGVSHAVHTIRHIDCKTFDFQPL